MTTPSLPPREGEPGYQGPRIRPRRPPTDKRSSLVCLAAGAGAALLVDRGDLALDLPTLLAALLLPLATGWWVSRGLRPEARRGPRATAGAPAGAGAAIALVFGYLVVTMFVLGGSADQALVGPAPLLVLPVLGAVAGAIGSQLVAPKDPAADW